ncbi:hypothetical protein [Gilvimarinus japonicus]|uniref:DUF2975 domain-containing protein n=1 Tax=Gilvimarinus japonicus TaxID=1796469 RepID=A0ABV7HWA7_9GAMM
MKRILDVVRFTFVSPEFAWILGLIALLYVYPYPLIVVGEKIGANDEVWKWLPTLPLLFSGITFRLSSKVRAPFDKGNKQLYEWLDFYRITDRLYTAYILAAISSISIISIWIFPDTFSLAIIGLVFFAAVGVSGFVALQVFLAAQKIREIIEQYGDQF